jgi:hypothetical protein
MVMSIMKDHGTMERSCVFLFSMGVGGLWCKFFLLFWEGGGWLRITLHRRESLEVSWQDELGSVDTRKRGGSSWKHYLGARQLIVNPIVHVENKSRKLHWYRDGSDL